MLVCPVRACGLPLVRTENRVACARGHSFDVARSGYINLLQPQDKKSKQPGDTVKAVAARRRLHERGVTAPLLHAIASAAELLPDDVVLDAGCGEGFYLGSLAAAGFDAHGIDISIPAIDLAARKYPACEWIVANADRQIPYGDATFSRVLSITARMNAAEFRRVLRDDGRLLVAIPAADDLIEIRGAGKDRVERTVAMFTDQFVLETQSRAATTAELDAASVEDIRHSIYRPLQAASAEAMRVTFALDVLRFRPA